MDLQSYTPTIAHNWTVTYAIPVSGALESLTKLKDHLE